MFISRFPRPLRHLLAAGTLILFPSVANAQPMKAAPTGNGVFRTFATADQRLQTTAYWYWLAGNVSRQGVENDLRTMKQQGINRAFIGIQGLGDDEVPRGNVRFMTDEWWDILRHAFHTAAELDIQLGIFNGPGWSHMGGMWVKPEESMRYLNARRYDIRGGKTVRLTLDRPADCVGDVALLAYPNRFIQPQKQLSVSVAASEGISNAAALLNDNGEDIAAFTADSAWIELQVNATDIPLRAIHLTAASALACEVSVQTMQDGHWQEAKRFDIRRTMMQNITGYDPYAPITEALSDVKTTAVRLVFSKIRKDSSLRNVRLSTEPTVNRYSEKILARMFQTPLPYWKEYKWPVEHHYTAGECVAVGDVIDLTSLVSDGTLTWQAPKGDWTVMQLYMSPTGIKCAPAFPEDGEGLEVDRWNRTALANHYNAYMGEIERRIPAEERKTWTTVVCDSYETATQNYGDDFLPYFRSHFGYDPLPYLLTYFGTVVGSEEQSDRFLWDVRRMIADRLAHDNIGAMDSIARAHGHHLWLENYGHWGFPGEFLQYGSRSTEVGGEFWSRGSLGDIENRAASSCAHIYGKRRVSAESFTVAGAEFSRSPRDFKQRGDRFFAEGINNTLLHVYVSQRNEDSIPDIIPWFGNEFNRKNTWYPHLHLFTDYLKRCNYLLQQGAYVADVAYYIGEDAPCMTGITEPALPAGHQFDYINAEVITTALQAHDDHTLSLPYGNRYRLLVLPPTNTMRPAVLRAVKRLVEDGGIVLGPKPTASPSMENYPACDDEVRSLADQLWGNDVYNPTSKRCCQVGKGFVFSGYTIEEIFERFHIAPDCRIEKISPPQSPEGDVQAGKASPRGGLVGAVVYCHMNRDGYRPTDDAALPSPFFPQESSGQRFQALPGISDIYFIANQADTVADISVSLRTAKGQPELWNAVDGSRQAVSTYRCADGITTVDLHLAPMESTFIVFHGNQSPPLSPEGEVQVGKNSKKASPRGGLEGALSTPWNVHFTSDYGVDIRCTMDTLRDWTTFADPQIKYLGGRALYTNTFRLTKEQSRRRIVLSLEHVDNICTVRVNGTEVGGLWTQPYLLDITEAVRKGNNTIEIDVANNLCNRMIGDKADPAHAQLRASHNTWKADSKLQPSGITGKVQLLIGDNAEAKGL